MSSRIHSNIAIPDLNLIYILNNDWKNRDNMELDNMKLLPRFKDCKTEDDFKKAAIKWIKHLESQDGINAWDLKKFDFGNQLDDFQNDDGNYSEVIEWIRWFFGLEHRNE